MAELHETRERLVTALAPLFQSLGLERMHGPLIAWVGDIPDGKRYASIDLAPYVDTFDLSLQSVSLSGERRSVALSQLGGSGEYSLGLHNDHLLDESIRRVKDDLACFGLPWLAGKDVVTEPMRANQRRARAAAAEGTIREAVSAFKARDYSHAAHLFHEASRSRQLTPAEALMSEYATRKATAKGA